MIVYFILLTFWIHYSDSVFYRPSKNGGIANLMSEQVNQLLISMFSWVKARCHLISAADSQPSVWWWCYECYYRQSNDQRYMLNANLHNYLFVTWFTQSQLQRLEAQVSLHLDTSRFSEFFLVRASGFAMKTLATLGFVRRMNVFEYGPLQIAQTTRSIFGNPKK